MTSSSLRFDHLQHQFEENPRRHFVPLARAFLGVGNAHRAVELCRTFLPQLPGHVSGHVVLAQALGALGADDEARAEYERVLALDAENVVAVRALGDLAEARGNPTEARGWYARLVELDSGDPDASRRLEQLGQAALAPTAAAPYETVEPEVLDERAEALDAQDIPGLDRDHALAEEFTAGFFASVLGEPEQRGGMPSRDEAPLSPDLDHLFDDASPPEALPGATELHATLSRDAGRDERDASQPPGDHEAPDGSVAPLMDEDPEDAEAAGDLGVAEPHAAFVTETMAELYLRQGFRDEALHVYRQLAEQSPDDDHLRSRVAELTAAETPPDEISSDIEPGRPWLEAEPPAAPAAQAAEQHEAATGHEDADVPRAETAGPDFAGGSMLEAVAGVQDRSWELAPPRSTPTVSAWLSRLVAGEAVAPPDVPPLPEARIAGASMDGARADESLRVDDLNPAVETAAEPAQVQPTVSEAEAFQQSVPEPAMSEPPEAPTVELATYELTYETAIHESTSEVAASDESRPDTAPTNNLSFFEPPSAPETDASAPPPAFVPAPEKPEATLEEWPTWDAESLLAPDTTVEPAYDPALQDEEIAEPSAAPPASVASDDPFAWDEPLDVPAPVELDASDEPFSLDELFARPADPADEAAAGSLVATTMSLGDDEDVHAQLDATAAEDPAGLGPLLRATPPGTPVSQLSSPADQAARPGASFSFEQFFRPTPAGGGVVPPAPPAAAEPPVARDDDLDEFHAWLAGLSKS